MYLNTRNIVLLILLHHINCVLHLHIYNVIQFLSFLDLFFEYFSDLFDLLRKRNLFAIVMFKNILIMNLNNDSQHQMDVFYSKKY